MNYSFPQVTLLITHYNRSQSLANLLQAFRGLSCQFADIIVSDDASKPEHLEKLRKWQEPYNFRLVTTLKNGGLGNNINKGQDVVRTPYTLYVQEDFVPKADFPEQLQQGLGFMEQDAELDIVRYYAYLKYPYLKPYAGDYKLMVSRPWYANYYKIYQYSDHPHLRRSTFLQKFGRYAEGINPERAEYRMCLSFIQQRGKGVFYTPFKALFDQINTAAEPSTMVAERKNWRRESNNPLVSVARELYRTLRYNYDLLFDWQYRPR